MKLLSLVLLAALFSCTNRTSSQSNGGTLTTKPQTETVADSSLDTNYVDIKGKQYKYLGVIPDSLRTPEQKKLINLLNEVTFKYLKVENNRMVFTLTKAQYVAKGIPGRYYDLLQKNIRDNNQFFESNGIEDVEKLLQDTRGQLANPK